MDSILVILGPILVEFSEKKFFGSNFHFWTPLPEKIGKNSSKMAKKWQFLGLKGELTQVSQVKITLFYYKMVNFVRKLQFLAPKIIFWCDFRPI